jgi:hypothetical protein
MSTQGQIHELRHPLNAAPEEADLQRWDAEPNEDRALSDAEEEEMAELWAFDRGNQGA